MVNIISTASELGYLNVPEHTLIEIDEMKNYPPEKMVLITTGSQGESMAALSRMAADVHRKVTIQPNDTIIFSSNPIPGNEKSVSKVINELSAKGANVIFQDAHVSGHACQEELKLIYSLVKPKYAVPVHGEYRHLKANSEIARNLGIPNENIFILQSGDVLEMDEESARVTDKVHTGAIIVDGLGVRRRRKYRPARPAASSGRRDHYRCADVGARKQPPACRTGYCFTRVCICEGV